MMFGLMRVRTHDAEIKRRDESLAYYKGTAAQLSARCGELNAEKRTIGAALKEALTERDTLQARLDALTPARGDDGRFTKREAVSNG